MEGSYPIYLGAEELGQAQVKRQGLYYHFYCECELSGEVIYRVTVSCNGKSESLGIPAPEGTKFTLNSRLPVSKLGQGEPKFQLLPRHPDTDERFVPLSPEEPFTYLQQLKDAYLLRRNGRLGIGFRVNSNKVPLGSDQNP